ncbi:hypothetical protein CVT26_006380 [Gymnopilus dilepis]|uniref:carbonic anhydrase n=1 Tax=Gymnopilus dilepis TaxID=231916 RepID=A0A409WBQ9_9AGAR|nr:hypothetical protein CVT26_006380 [Gymnopilus dilepis]
MRAQAFKAALWLFSLSLTPQIYAVTTSYYPASSPLNSSTLNNATDSPTSSGNLDILATGNEFFRKETAKTNPGLLRNLTVNGQHPPFMYLGCADSRVSEGTIFNAKPGTLLVQRNIANQFLSLDDDVQGVFSYAVAELGVAHIIVMGHYGCGAVGAAIQTPPPTPVDGPRTAVRRFVAPIREIYYASNRTEIVKLRQRNERLQHVDFPAFDEPGYRALVEANIEVNVRRIAESSLIRNLYSTRGHDLFIHGFVYDISDGRVYNLGVSVGPPGVEVPSVPFPLVSVSAIWLFSLSITGRVYAVTTPYHPESPPFQFSPLGGAGGSSSGLGMLAVGNEIFRTEIAITDPGLLTNLTVNGQRQLISRFHILPIDSTRWHLDPQFLYLGCSDSRVSAGTIFNAKPGTLFVQRNIANQFLNLDDDVQAVFSYAVDELGVSHIIVMGHYGCGGVAAAIATPPSPPIEGPDTAIQNWISSIREIYNTSNRTEIVQLRQKNAHLQHVDPPPFNDPGYRALIEENVVTGVRRIAESSLIRNLYSTREHDLFIHGFVYDISNGRVYNLGVSVGPPGVQIPVVPFPRVPAVHH